MNKENTFIVDEKGSIEYIGYINMLEKILNMIDDFSYSNRLILLDKYIEILRIVKGGKLMKITLDYEEYLKLKEKADLNQSNIDKMRNKLQKTFNLATEQIRKEIINDEQTCYKNKIKDKLNRIKKRSIDNSRFGYISLTNLFKIIDKENI